MPAAPARFRFDLDLGGAAERSEPMVAESAVAALLAEAREAARAEGFAAGERSAMARAAHQLASAATTLADEAAGFAAAAVDARTATLADAAELALTIARKLARTLVAREPTAEIEALLVECLGALDGVPHLVIRCHPGLADAVREIASARIATSGFTGRLVVMGDPDQGLGDGRIEWADGGIARDMDAVSAAIDRRVAAYLAAHGAAIPGESGQ